MGNSDKGKPGKPDKEEKSHPLSVPLVLLSDMPPARNHAGRLVAVKNEDGFTTVLAYSDGTDWLKIHFEGPIEEEAGDGAQPELPV